MTSIAFLFSMQSLAREKHRERLSFRLEPLTVTHSPKRIGYPV